MLVLNNVSAAPGKTRVHLVVGVELCLAVHAASAPEHEPLSHAAREIVAAMPPGPRRTLEELTKRIPDWSLYVLNTFYRLGVRELGDSLIAFAAEDPPDVAVDILRAFAPAGVEPLDDAVSDSGLAPDVARRLLRAIACPKVLVMQVLEVLTAFARSGFGRWWDEQQDGLLRLAAALDAQLTADFARTAMTLSPRVVSDRSLDRLTFMGGNDVDVVDCARFTGFDVLPSRWLRQRVVLHRTSGRFGVGVGCGPSERHEFDRQQAPAMLTALGDERRFSILRLCLMRGHTTSELAVILGITEGPVSRHLKELERGGLVSSERFGRQVQYSTGVEVLNLLGLWLQRLPQQVWSESAVAVAA